MFNPRAVLWNVPIIEVLAAYIGKIINLDVTSPEIERHQSPNWASTERRQIRVLHLEQSKGSATAFTHNRSIGHLYRKYRECWCRCTWKWASTVPQHSLNTASTQRQQSVNDCGFAACVIQGLCYGIYPWSKYWPPFWETWLEFILLHLKISVNRVTTELWQFWALHLVWCKGCAMAFTHNRRLAALICIIISVNFAIILSWSSTEHQCFLVM